MVFMGKRVKEHSNGKMRVDIYPGGQLGAERELIELLQIGSLAMTKVSTAPLEAFVPEMRIFGMPYLFRDQEHRWKMLNSPTGKRLLLSGEPFFLRGLCYYDAGSRSFYSVNKPIHSPDDLQGMDLLGLAHGVGSGYPRPAIATHKNIPYTMLLADWKIIKPKNDPPSLYNVADDPTEQTDVIADHPMIARWLSDSLSLFLAYDEEWQKSTFGVASNLDATFPEAISTLSERSR